MNSNRGNKQLKRTFIGSVLKHCRKVSTLIIIGAAGVFYTLSMMMVSEVSRIDLGVGVSYVSI